MPKKPSMPYYLPLASGVGNNEYFPFPRVLVQSEMQTSLPRIWTQISDSISNDNDCYMKHASTPYIKNYVIATVLKCTDLEIKRLGLGVNEFELL